LGGRIGWRDELRDHLRGRTIGGVIERSQVLVHRATGLVVIDILVLLHAGDRSAFVRVGLDETPVHRKTFTADEAKANSYGLLSREAG
jgi:hypothetical protein